MDAGAPRDVRKTRIAKANVGPWLYVNGPCATMAAIKRSTCDVVGTVCNTRVLVSAALMAHVKKLSATNADQVEEIMGSVGRCMRWLSGTPSALTTTISLETCCSKTECNAGRRREHMEISVTEADIRGFPIAHMKNSKVWSERAITKAHYHH